DLGCSSTPLKYLDWRQILIASLMSQFSKGKYLFSRLNTGRIECGSLFNNSSNSAMKSLRRVTHSALLSSVFTTLDVMIILSGTDAASRPKAGGTSTLVTQASAVIAPSKKQICLSPRLPIDQHDETIRPDIAAAKRNWSAPRERSVRSGSSSSFAPAPSLCGTAATGVEALFVPIASACGDLCLPNILATFSSTAFMLPSRAIPHPPNAIALTIPGAEICPERREVARGAPLN